MEGITINKDVITRRAAQGARSAPDFVNKGTRGKQDIATPKWFIAYVVPSSQSRDLANRFAASAEGEKTPVIFSSLGDAAVEKRSGFPKDLLLVLTGAKPDPTTLTDLNTRFGGEKPILQGAIPKSSKTPRPA